jgi:hypothetical protein
MFNHRAEAKKGKLTLLYQQAATHLASTVPSSDPKAAKMVQARWNGVCHDQTITAMQPDLCTS